MGSYELLLWLIRTAADDAVAREPAVNQAGGPADHPVAGLRLVSMPDLDAPGGWVGLGSRANPGSPEYHGVGPDAYADRACGPDRPAARQAYRTADQETAERSLVNGDDALGEDNEMEVNLAAVAAYRASLDTGVPLSERKLAAMFGKTSRRWARNRMAEAVEGVTSATANVR